MTKQLKFRIGYRNARMDAGANHRWCSGCTKGNVRMANTVCDRHDTVVSYFGTCKDWRRKP